MIEYETKFIFNFKLIMQNLFENYYKQLNIDCIVSYCIA